MVTLNILAYFLLHLWGFKSFPYISHFENHRKIFDYFGHFAFFAGVQRPPMHPQFLNNLTYFETIENICIISLILHFAFFGLKQLHLQFCSLQFFTKSVISSRFRVMTQLSFFTTLMLLIISPLHFQVLITTAITL